LRPRDNRKRRETDETELPLQIKGFEDVLSRKRFGDSFGKVLGIPSLRGSRLDSLWRVLVTHLKVRGTRYGCQRSIRSLRTVVSFVRRVAQRSTQWGSHHLGTHMFWKAQARVAAISVSARQREVEWESGEWGATPLKSGQHRAEALVLKPRMLRNMLL